MNMNLDSIHRLIEESQIVQMQQSSMKARCDVTEPASSPKDTCRSSLPVYGRPSHVTPNFRAHSFTTNKWDICEELRLRELEEAKARAAQMEKTMRWWSDCTANWREKWSKVRAERNSAREEARQLRVKLEMTVKELSTLKKKQRMPLQKEASDANVSQDLELPSFLEESYDHRDQSQRKPQGPGAAREHLMKRETDEQNTNSKEDGAVTDPLGVKEDRKPNPDCADLFMKGGSPICAVSPVLTLPAANLCLGNEVTESSASRVHSVECQKIFWKEREMRAALEKEVERLESALSLWKWKYEELKKLKAASTREFDAIHGQHENDSEKERTAGDVWEECQFQNSKDRVICESRTKRYKKLDVKLGEH